MKNIHDKNVDEYSSVYKNDLIARSYEVRNKVEVIKPLIPQLRSSSEVLEIGYGTGDLLHHLVVFNKPRAIYGIEIVEEAAKLYRKRFPKDKNMKLITTDANRKLPFKKNQFDLIILSHVLEHLKNEEKILQNLNFILKDNGYIILAVPEYGDSHLHYRQYNKKHMIYISSRLKMRSIQINGYGFYINKLFYKILKTVLGSESTIEHSHDHVHSPPVSERTNSSFLRNIYYNIIVDVLLFLDKVDSLLFSKIDKHPMQWIGVYKK